MPRFFAPFGRLVAPLLLLGAQLMTVPAAADSPKPGAIPDNLPVSDWQLCHGHIAAAEKLMEMPAHLLTAISRTESGRWSKEHRAHLAWPWTVMAEGKGRYLPSKAAAVAEVKALKAKGVTNIDVGCMQINLRYHPDAFDSLDQAFDPAFNVAYAATFLSGLRDSQNSWTKAIGRYHSATPMYANRYRAKVFKFWNEEKRLAAKAAREARREAREAAAAAEQAVAAEQTASARKVEADPRLASLASAGAAVGSIR
jgi:soluble lytic murein transglycosylase-like protein